MHNNYSFLVTVKMQASSFFLKAPRLLSHSLRKILGANVRKPNFKFKIAILKISPQNNYGVIN